MTHQGVTHSPSSQQRLLYTPQVCRVSFCTPPQARAPSHVTPPGPTHVYTITSTHTCTIADQHCYTCLPLSLTSLCILPPPPLPYNHAPLPSPPGAHVPATCIPPTGRGPGPTRQLDPSLVLRDTPSPHDTPAALKPSALKPPLLPSVTVLRLRSQPWMPWPGAALCTSHHAT